MNHLRRKFIKAITTEADLQSAIDASPTNDVDINAFIDQGLDSHYIVSITEDNKLLQSFPYKKDNKTYFIPEPNPIVLYFDTSRFYAKHSIPLKNKLFEELDSDYPHSSEILKRFHEYYAYASISAIFLFNSVEAFINFSIPDDFEFKKQSDKKEETYNAFQIQKYLQIEEKIKSIVPKIKGKSFVHDFAHKYDSLLLLKKFRDEIMHTKSYSMTTTNFFRDLFTTAIDFDFEKALLSARDFINYYEPDLIEECNCGKDF